MTTLSLVFNKDLKQTDIFTVSKLQQFREDLERSTQERFKEIDRNKSISLDEARKKYLD